MALSENLFKDLYRLMQEGNASLIVLLPQVIAAKLESDIGTKVVLLISHSVREHMISLHEFLDRLVKAELSYP